MGRFGTLLSIVFVSPSDGVPSVLGCFGDGDGKGGGGPHVLPHQLPDVGYSPDSCAAGCAKLSFAVGGMEDGTQCFCGNWTAVFAKRHVSDGYCSTACPDPSPLSNHCGGPWYITSFWLGGGPAPAPPPTPPMPTPAPAPPGGIPDCPFTTLPYCNASLDRALRVSAMTSPPPPDFTHRLSIAGGRLHLPPLRHGQGQAPGPTGRGVHQRNLLVAPRLPFLERGSARAVQGLREPHQGRLHHRPRLRHAVPRSQRPWLCHEPHALEGHRHRHLY